MTEQCSKYELVKDLPDLVGQVLMKVVTAIRPEECPDPKVRKDLIGYQECLLGMREKAQKSTQSLLQKPRVVIFLKGEPLPEPNPTAELEQLTRELERIKKEMEAKASAQISGK
nr:MAG: protein B [Hubei sediment noda-like virus 7]